MSTGLFDNDDRRGYRGVVDPWWTKQQRPGIFASVWPWVRLVLLAVFVWLAVIGAVTVLIWWL